MQTLPTIQYPEALTYNTVRRLQAWAPSADMRALCDQALGGDKKALRRCAAIMMETWPDEDAVNLWVEEGGPHPWM